MRHAIHNAYKGVAEQLLPLRTAPGGFRTEGVLTPDEFVAAGDFLVAAVPTWSWEAGDKAKSKPFLPPAKQYLVTRNVPCFRRAAAVEGEPGAGEAVVEEGAIGAGDGGWLAPGLVPGGEGEGRESAAATGADDSAASDAGSTLTSLARRAAELPDAADGEPASAPPAVRETDEGAAAAPEAGGAGAKPGAADADADADDPPDISDWAHSLPSAMASASLGPGDDAAAAPPHAFASEPEDPILRTRTYDVSITYDRYYATPRIWLAGYDEQRAPLPPGAALADVSSEHARKTVTIDGHPHTGVAAVSIHPCKHGAVMKRLGDAMAAGGAEPRPEQYLLLFLRLVQTAVPTVEYDFGVSMGRGE